MTGCCRTWRWLDGFGGGGMSDEIARVAVHDTRAVCGSRQNSGSQTVMKEPRWWALVTERLSRASSDG